MGRLVNSRMLGSVALETDRLARDLAVLESAPVHDDYSEYAFGSWHAFILANPTGDESDTRFRPSGDEPAVTGLGRRMPYVMSLVDRHFDRRTLRWVRIFTAQDALLVTHRDFLEFAAPLHRLHLVLETDETCLHSEDDIVYHMRRGELWDLDGTVRHAACTLSASRRVSLVLDFEQDGTPAEARVRSVDPPSPPCLPERPPLTRSELEGVFGLEAIACAGNFRDIVRLLGKVHFYRRTGAADLFDWIEHIVRNDVALLQRARAYRRFCLEARGYQDRFGSDG